MCSLKKLVNDQVSSKNDFHDLERKLNNFQNLFPRIKQDTVLIKKQSPVLIKSPSNPGQDGSQSSPTKKMGKQRKSVPRRNSNRYSERLACSAMLACTVKRKVLGGWAAATAVLARGITETLGGMTRQKPPLGYRGTHHYSYREPYSATLWHRGLRRLLQEVRGKRDAYVSSFFFPPPTGEEAQKSRFIDA